jgi:hypothetical protein
MSAGDSRKGERDDEMLSLAHRRCCCRKTALLLPPSAGGPCRPAPPFIRLPIPERGGGPRRKWSRGAPSPQKVVVAFVGGEGGGSSRARCGVRGGEGEGGRGGWHDLQQITGEEGEKGGWCGPPPRPPLPPRGLARLSGASLRALPTGGGRSSGKVGAGHREREGRTVARERERERVNEG